MTISEMSDQPEWLPGFLEFYNRPERPTIWTALRHYHNKFGDKTALPDWDEVVAVVETLGATTPETFQTRSNGPEPQLQYLPYELLEGRRGQTAGAVNMKTFEMTDQSIVEGARKVVLRRRAYCENFLDLKEKFFDASGAGEQAIAEFSDAASDEERARFLTEAPAELAASFVTLLDEKDRIRAIETLRDLDPEAFSKLLEGL
ncbi:hypothetical protein [Epibacterium ulvae]|uniref:hypothetical protein n=1 Tax=Epibacterium ulvae TaxID=1156985 RepID=UPI0024907800|nr:hypothetical protein [Epibacterium ulvae]